MIVHTAANRLLEVLALEAAAQKEATEPRVLGRPFLWAPALQVSGSLKDTQREIERSQHST